MNVKNENEITVRVLSSLSELTEDLEKEGFKQSGKFTLDDRYLVPGNTDLDELSTREIVARAVILRTVCEEDGNCVSKVVFKQKEISKSGEILSQKSYQCEVSSIDDALSFFNALGYSELMRILENDLVFSKGNMHLAVKDVQGSGLLIEFETCRDFDTVDKLKKGICSLDIQIDKSDFFVKKAEIELNRVLQNLQNRA